MPETSSPHDAAPLTLILVSVPFPLELDGRHRHRTFFESRISRSGPPTARKRGVATVVPPAFWPDRATTVAFLDLRSTR